MIVPGINKAKLGILSAQRVEYWSTPCVYSLSLSHVQNGFLHCNLLWERKCCIMSQADKSSHHLHKMLHCTRSTMPSMALIKSRGQLPFSSKPNSHTLPQLTIQFHFPYHSPTFAICQTFAIMATRLWKRLPHGAKLADSVPLFKIPAEGTFIKMLW